MEILSVGEKIKRARIYKRLTLKDICDDKISVSKMSCIENGKIAPDDYVIELLTKKLDVSEDYLRYDVKTQFLHNLDKFKEIEEKDKEEFLKYNIYYSKEYKYYDMAFEFMHLLFNYHIDKSDIDAARRLTSEYYEICRKIDKHENEIKYSMDVGRFLFSSGEYIQAANHYNNLEKSIEEISSSNKDELMAENYYYEAEAYLMAHFYNKALEVASRILDYIPVIKKDSNKADVYNLIAFLCLKTNNEKYKELKSKAKKYYDLSNKIKAQYTYICSLELLKEGKIHEFKKYLCEALELCPRDEGNIYSHFMVDYISELINDNDIDKYEELCDAILDYAIKQSDNLIIEKAYYLKAKIFEKNENLISFEMYMNLSLDFLSKLGDNKKLYYRYLEMGKMYYKFNNTKESLKYFNLAINLSKKI